MSFIPQPSSFSLPVNPFPGLRPFRSDEHHLFFGREEQTAALLQLLRTNRFLAVVGTSGSGKSSLVRAGMIAELHGGTMTQVGSTWEVMILRPGGSPIENLARAFVEADLYDAEDASTLPRLLATLRRSRFGLVEAMKQSDVFEPGTNLLVVVDQFEELFRFRQSGIESEEAATAFVNLLLTAAQQAECPIYVTITMRSDYLGDCSEIPGLAEAVNEGEYLIPRLMRDQKRDAIEKPIGVGGAKISPLLVQRLLNDVGDDPDQLPVLQHALMRMWEVWSAGNDHSRPIDFTDLEATGGLASALSNHADEIYDSLPGHAHRAACEKIFKTLTERGDDNRGIRRPTRLSRLQAIAGADRATTIAVLDAFRQSGVTFLMPGIETSLADRTVVDLSHESLMRGWQRLRSWVEEEAQSARVFRRVLDTARLWNDGKAGLFRDPDLQIALSWRQEEQPNAQWADQYGGDFETAISFLESSNADAVAERQAREAARHRELEQARRLAEAERQRATDQARAALRLRWMVRGLGLVAMVAIMATVFAWLARQEANRNADAALHAQQNTERALKEAEAAETLAKDNEAEAERQKAAALLAEQRSREFRYATDVQLAATLVADPTANATQIHTRLSDHDPESNRELQEKEDLRGFEWHYLKRLVEDRATVFDGFEKEVVGVAMSPNGELVTLDSDGRLQHFNPATRQETRPALDLRKGRNVSASTLSRDGLRVALATGDTVRLIDTTTGDENTRTISARTRNGLMFSPDGSMVITVDTGLGWWDAATGNPIAVDEVQLTAVRPGFAPVAVSGDGLTVAVGGQGDYRGRFSVFRMDPPTHGITRLLDKVGDEGTKRALAVSPDGQTIAVSYYFAGGISLYDSATGKQLLSRDSVHPASVLAIAFNPDSAQIVTAALDGSVKVWKDHKLLEATEATALVGHAQPVDTLAWVAAGKQVLSAGRDKSVRLWNLDQHAGSLHRTIVGATGFRARYSHDGMLMAVAGESDAIQLRDGHTGEVVARFPRESSEFGSDSVALSPDNRLLAVGFGGRQDVSFIELWDIDRRERLAVMPGSTAIPGFTTDEYNGLVSGLAFSPDGKHLVAGFGSLNMLTRGDYGNFPLLVYDVASQRIVRRLEGPRNFCISVAFSPDGSSLASACFDGSVRIWDTMTWRELQVLENPDTASESGNRRVTDVAFSPDGNLLAMASAERNVIVWNMETGEPLQSLSGHANEVWSVAFSPDGRTLASGSMDGSVRLWNTATWRELLRLEPGTDFSPRSLTFSPDSKRLLAAGSSVVEWSVQPADTVSKSMRESVADWWDSGVDIRNRVRMHSEQIRLRETLETLVTQTAGDRNAQAALAAISANWHASFRQWDAAVEQFDQFQQLSPESPDTWLRTPGLLRLATALLHLDRPADAAHLLAGGEKRRAQDGSGNRTVRLGIQYTIGKFPLTLTKVDRGSPAWQAGVRTGDLLLKFNDIEFNSTTLADFLALMGKGEGTQIGLTIQHPGQTEPVTVQSTIASYIQDDVSAELIEILSAAVDKKLAESATDAGLHELRAELARLSSDYGQQVIDYTAAIEALTGHGEEEHAADLARLYGRRGNAYVGLKQWQQAVDDYARSASDATTDDAVRSNRALALAEVSLGIWTPLIPSEMKSEGGATLTLLEDGSILSSGKHPERDDYTIVAPIGVKNIRAVALDVLPHESLNGNVGRGVTGNFIITEFKVSALDSAGTRQPIQLKDAVVDYGQVDIWATWDGRDVTNGDVNDLGWKVEPHVNVPHRLVARLDQPIADGVSALTFVIQQHHFNNAHPRGLLLGRFRLSVSDDPSAFDRAQQQFAAMKLTDPWQKLAAAYRIQGNEPAIDQLVEQRPQLAGTVGDLFIAGEFRDWQRAAEIYSLGFTPETTDADLLTRRAKAYEELKDWSSAAADWTRAAGEMPEKASLLIDFAGRLLKASQQKLALASRQRAREILEATLNADPGNATAIDALPALLLDMSESATEWTAIEPSELKPSSGATLVPHDDNSAVVEQIPYTLKLSEPGNALQAIRIETSPHETPPAAIAAPFSEYQILSTDLPAAGFRGRYVRIDLPGDNSQFPRHSADKNLKYINLSELQIFQGDQNLALNSKTRASSGDGDYAPERAVDGNTAGNDETHSYAHTWDTSNPWWEVDLGSDQAFDRMVVWNRTDVESYPRMNHFRVQVLDANRELVFERVIDNAPSPSTEIARPVQLSKVEPDTADGGAHWQISFNREREQNPWRRLRISMTDEQSTIAVDASGTPNVNWTVPKPSNVVLPAETPLTAQEDGSWIVEVDDSIALPMLAPEVKGGIL